MNQGQDFVTLTVNQMPPHSHNWGSSHHDGNPTNNPGVNNNDPQTNNDFFKVTTATGGGQPFDNRPAGRTILLCRKN
jgi:microcystin-dependent protein